MCMLHRPTQLQLKLGMGHRRELMLLFNAHVSYRTRPKHLSIHTHRGLPPLVTQVLPSMSTFLNCSPPWG
jgi:hypothetical protein